MSGLTRRTQLLLDEERHGRLEEESRRTGRSIASLVREAIDARYRLAELTDDRRRAATELLSAPRPAGAEPDWSEIEREMLDSRGAPGMW
jgi:predicted DNA-binding protein